MEAKAISINKFTIMALIICVLVSSSLLLCTNVNLEKSAKPYQSLFFYPQADKLLANSASSEFILLQNSNQESDPFITAVKEGTKSNSDITVNNDLIGSFIKIDLRIDNVSIGFWGWSLPSISWDPAVLNLTDVQEGAFIVDQTGASAYFIGNSPALWNNTSGKIDGGLTEALSADRTSHDSSGVLATLTFEIKSNGNSPVTLSGAFTVASINQADTKLYPPNYLSCYNATINVLSTNSSPLNLPSWLIVPLVIIPLICVLAYAWKKRMPGHSPGSN